MSTLISQKKDLRKILTKKREIIKKNATVEFNYNVFNILKTDMSTSTNVIKDFLLKKYHLESDYALCPISDSNNDKKFIFDIEYEKGSNKQQFIIKAPIDNDDLPKRLFSS